MRSFAVSFSLFTLVTTVFAAPASAHTNHPCFIGGPLSGKKTDCSAIVPRGGSYGKWKGGDDNYDNSLDKSDYGSGYDYDPAGDQGDYDGGWGGDDGDGGYYDGGDNGRQYGGNNGGNIGGAGSNFNNDWGVEGGYYENGWGNIPDVVWSGSFGPGGSQNPNNPGSPAGSAGAPSTSSAIASSASQTSSSAAASSSAPVPFANGVDDLLRVTAVLDGFPTMRPGPNGAPVPFPAIGIL